MDCVFIVFTSAQYIVDGSVKEGMEQEHDWMGIRGAAEDSHPSYRFVGGV